ncbi:hypothetical protein DN752_19405 [Echinicola strongylocentroti]|uniref:FecR family protein n=1 Tax=Echinicola strongylocentroti TaxID=1795355 RepID=A0A2Z4IN17_9BACT|nr:FecR domain-containing protein [Echinicola strongylocentroti]AWW32130.1 hypothetical protein DN752_19405 [Echinicola strongylocentroti]
MKEEDFNKLLERYVEGSLSPEESKLLDEFFDSYLEQEDEGMGSGTALERTKETMFQKITSKGNKEEVVRKERIPTYMLLGLLAIILLLWTGSTQLWNQDTKWIVETAPFGENRSIVLDDGTEVFLNAGSTLTYPERFQSNKREVRLEGEGFFKVTPDKLRPFEVISGQLKTTVLGTSFNIKAFQEFPITVSVLTGKVKLSENGQSVDVESGWQSVFKGVDQKFSLSQTDVEKSILWREGVISFQDTELIEALEVIKRYYNVHFQVNSPLPTDKYITAEFDQEPLPNVLQTFKYVMDIDYSYINDSTILIK